MTNVIEEANQQIGVFSREECMNAIERNDEEMVKLAMSYLIDTEGMPRVYNKVRSKEEAQKYQDLGSKIMSKKETLDEAIEYFTKSIVYAPTGSRQLAFCYESRAQALMKARLYEDCLLDVSRAIKAGYPKQLRAKLYAYQAKSFTALRQFRAEAKEAILNARKSLDKLKGVDKEIVEEILNEVKKRGSIPTPVEKWDDKKHLPVTPMDNAELPGVSSAVELKYSEEFGRHLVSARDIQCGETLLVEKNYVGVLIGDNYHTHCSNCWKQTWSGIPCNNCVNVIFCSETCRDAAWSEFHDVECPILDSILDAQLNKLSLISLRVFVKALKEFGSLEALKAETERLDSLADKRTRGFTEGIFDATKYASFYMLPCPILRDAEVRHRTALEAAEILYFLAIKTKVLNKEFEDCRSLMSDPYAKFVGGLLLRHTTIARFGSVKISDYCFQSEELIYRGQGVFNSFNLCNHSCEHVLYASYYANYGVLTSLKPIKKGEQAFISYGPTFHSMATEERQAILQSQFGFYCECTPCQRGWSPLTRLPSMQTLPTFREFDLTSLIFRYQRFCRNFHEGEDFVKNHSNPKDIIQLLNLLWSNAKNHCREIEGVEAGLLEILWRRGNRFQILDTRRFYETEIVGIVHILMHIFI